MVPEWPRRVRGRGAPCQPHAFSSVSRRAAFDRGVTAFPKHLARNLDVQLRTRVDAVALVEGGFRLVTDPPGDWATTDLVLALPVEQMLPLLSQVASASDEARGATALLETLGSLSCLTVMAGYPADAPEPQWDVCYPEESRVLQLVSHDSSKRVERTSLVLVLQARPGWSKSRLEAPSEAWGAEILEEAGRLFGPWVSRPTWTRTHRWRYARADAGSQLSGPMLLRFPGGGRLGVAGEVFSQEAGLEGSWLSGRKLARRLVEAA